MPEEGYYLKKSDKVPELCSANILECNKCTRTGESERPTCTECDNELSFFSDSWDCKCPPEKFFNTNRECKDNYPNCPWVENLTENCLDADHGYFILKGLKGTKKCSDSVQQCLSCSRTDPSDEPVCISCPGDLTVFQAPTQECRCPAGQYYDSSFKCQDYTTGCKIHENISGKCTEPILGYYLDDHANPIACSTMLGCQECDRSGAGGKPFCTVCINTAVFDSELNECKRTNCASKQWYDTSMVC